MKLNHNELMSGLAEKHDLIAGMIGKSKVRYIDVPFYENVGDLLIMNGTEKFFIKNNIDVIGRYFFFNVPIKKFSSDDVLVFQGGGNFGDLYTGPQQIRELVIETLTSNKIIILPQTIHFESEEDYEKCCIKLRKHPDLHICVRDKKSFSYALNMTDNVYLLPDMAHQLWPTQQLNTPSKSTLGLYRTDNEYSGNERKYDLDSIADWNELFGKQTIIYPYLQNIMRTIPSNLFESRCMQKLVLFWQKYAEKQINKSVEMFCNHKIIYTDRLHGHILACLLNKEHYILDNSYGKNSSYIEQWTCNSPLTNIIKN